jgi:DNA-directed RNA polymerase specialized sigma24 family protein
MYAVAHRFFYIEDDAQGCLQKAFIQVFKNIASFQKIQVPRLGYIVLRLMKL